MAMNGLTKMAAMALLLVLAVVPATVAVTYTVGDIQGWSIGVDYTTWGTRKTFKVAFMYDHTESVSEVDAAGYASCGGGTAIKTYSGGNTEIELKTVGLKYFISPTPGHCQSGMKLSITVVDTSSGSLDTLIAEE